jgi:hypothetical protein
MFLKQKVQNNFQKLRVFFLNKQIIVPTQNHAKTKEKKRGKIAEKQCKRKKNMYLIFFLKYTCIFCFSFLFEQI